VVPLHSALLADARADYYRHYARTDWQDLRLAVSDDNSASLRFYVPNPFTDRHHLRAADAARREGEAAAAFFLQQNERAAYELAQEIIYEVNIAPILVERQQITAEWIALVKERQEARAATHADLIALELQDLRLRTSMRQSVLAYENGNRILHTLSGGRPFHDFRISHEKVRAHLDEQRLVNNAYKKSPELAAARAASDRAHASLMAARATQIPWFDYVQAGWSQADSNSRDEDEWSARVAVNIPVFAWMDSGKIKAAAAELDAANWRETAVKQRIRDEIANNHAELRELLAAFEEYRSLLDAIPVPTAENVPDPETRFKLADARLAAAEHLLKLELKCALVYVKLIY